MHANQKNGVWPLCLRPGFHGQSYPVDRRRLPVTAPRLVLQVDASGASQGPGGGVVVVLSQGGGLREPSIVWPACHVGRLPLVCGWCWSRVRPQAQQMVDGLALAARRTMAEWRWWVPRWWCLFAIGVAPGCVRRGTTNGLPAQGQTAAIRTVPILGAGCKYPDGVLRRAMLRQAGSNRV